MSLLVFSRLTKILSIATALLIAGPAAAQSTAAIPSESDVPIAMLVDITSGQVLHSRNIDRRFVPASMTKVTTLYHAFELIDEGKLDPAQVLTMSDETWAEWNGEGSTMWINASDQVAVESLLMKYHLKNIILLN